MPNVELENWAELDLLVNSGWYAENRLYLKSDVYLLTFKTNHTFG